MLRKWALLICLAWVSTGRAGVDTSQTIFFPPSLGQQVETYLAFPLTWWNFFTFDIKGDTDFSVLQKSCPALRAQSSTELATLICGDDLDAFEPMLRDWARDQGLRAPPPTMTEWRAALDDALAKASLPIPAVLLRVLRFDPLRSYEALQKQMQARSLVNLPRKNGVFFDAEVGRALIPVKMTYPPSESDRTLQLLNTLDEVCRKEGKCDQWGFLGPHASTVSNRLQIQRDLSRVTWVGTGLLILGLFIVAIYGRWRLLLIPPLVAISIILSTLLTRVVFGSIHGLTLSFGTGIVGLALDYGFNRAFNSQKSVARSNLFGLLTTVAALVVLMVSEVPLIRQMMFFSAVGITLGFVFIWVAYEWGGWFRDIAPFSLVPRPSRWAVALVAVLTLSGAAGVLFLRPTFDLAKFNFQSRKEQQLMSWLVKVSRLTPPLFIVHTEPTRAARLESSEAAREWAGDRVALQTVAAYLPGAAEQAHFLKAWQGEPCSGEPAFLRTVRPGLSPTEKVFFEPFLQSLTCRMPGPGEASPLPAYLADFESRERWLTLFFPPDEAAAQSVKTRYPEATSLRALVGYFPERLARELTWMVPLSLICIAGLLWINAGRLGLALLSMLPFVTGMGLVFLTIVVGRLEYSFVTLIGLVMLCGLSVDYGIFALDAARTPEISSTPGAWTAILFSGATTLAGFLPLVFCEHPVLFQLGIALVAGTTGTIIGAFWGVPFVMKQFGERVA
jgi:hypothetical protein